MKLTLDTQIKILRADGSSCNGGSGKWHLPQNGKPGKQDVTDPNRYTKTLLETRFERKGLETFTDALSQLREFAAASSGIHTLVTQTEAPK